MRRRRGHDVTLRDRWSENAGVVFPTVLVWLSLLAFAVSVGRAFIDWGIVYPEFGMVSDPANVFAMLIGYSLSFGAWAWALIAMARGQRRGVWVALVLTLLMNLGLGLGTTFAFCPTPCQTLWPVGELWNWATTLTGAAAVIAHVGALRSRGTDVARNIATV